MSTSQRSLASTLTIAGAAALTGALAYAVYFDYKRRNDADFRKKLRKEKKKVEKTKAAAAPKAAEAGETGSLGVTEDELRTALAKVRSEEIPVSPEQREQYFLGQVSMGEQLCQQGPLFTVPAAMCFYRALRVYPSPVELIVIYEKTVPPAVFQVVMAMTNIEVKERVEGYYDAFPSKSMNVAVKSVDVVEADGEAKKRKILVATKDFAPGEVIYKEHPVVAVLDPDLQGAGTHCSHCLRAVNADTLVRAEEDPFSSVYCSDTCRIKAKAQYQTLLFSSGSALPLELQDDESLDNSTEGRGARAAAQAKFAAFLKGEAREKGVPLLLARFIARQVGIETVKMLPTGAGVNVAYTEDLPETDLGPGGPEYSLWDHIERLRYLDMQVPDDEHDMMVDVLKTALPGLETFLTDEKHAMLKGKIAYNAIGVCYPPSASKSTDDLGAPLPAGRDDKPVSKARPEEQERTRTPHGTSRQIGSGFYVVSSYIGHNCDPSVRPSFRDGDATLALVANRAIKAGDELTISYVDSASHPGESLAESRKRRRFELARGWRFACTCARCATEGAEVAATSEDIPVQKDESKVEEVVTRGESQIPAASSATAPEAQAAPLETALAEAEIAVAEVAVVDSAVVEAVVEAVPEPTAEPVVEPTPEPATARVAEPTVAATAEPAAPPAAEPAPEPATEPTIEQASESVSETASDSAFELISEPSSEPTTDAVAEPATEAVVAPEAEVPAEAATEAIAEPVTEATAELAPEAATEPAPEATIEPPVEHTPEVHVSEAHVPETQRLEVAPEPQA